MSDDLIIPVIEERAHVTKRVSDIERVRVSTTPVSEEVVVRDALRQQHVEVTRIPIGREVAEAPLTRTEGDTTIVPVIEERLVVEKRLFLVEEVHLRVRTRIENIEMPTTLRRTRVDVERNPLNT
jgi:stress response protein YsnF